MGTIGSEHGPAGIDGRRVDAIQKVLDWGPDIAHIVAVAGNYSVIGSQPHGPHRSSLDIHNLPDLLVEDSHLWVQDFRLLKVCGVVAHQPTNVELGSDEQHIPIG